MTTARWLVAMGLTGNWAERALVFSLRMHRVGSDDITRAILRTAR